MKTFSGHRTIPEILGEQALTSETQFFKKPNFFIHQMEQLWDVYYNSSKVISKNEPPLPCTVTSSLMHFYWILTHPAHLTSPLSAYNFREWAFQLNDLHSKLEAVGKWDGFKRTPTRLEMAANDYSCKL